MRDLGFQVSFIPNYFFYFIYLVLWLAVSRAIKIEQATDRRGNESKGKKMKVKSSDGSRKDAGMQEGGLQ